MAGRGKAAIKSETPERIVIKSPNFEVVELGIRGDAQLVSNNFSQEAIDQMKVEQEKGSEELIELVATAHPSKATTRRFVAK